MRFTSHLDLHRSWERTFRRAGLPLAYSEGFNPQPKLNIGAALPLGCLSQGDLIDAWLEAEIDPSEVESSLREASPPGIQVEDVQFVGAGEPVLQRRVQAAIYLCDSSTPVDPDEIEQRIEAMMRADHLPRTRAARATTFARWSRSFDSIGLPASCRCA
jgi:radical SAM-linked protein